MGRGEAGGWRWEDRCGLTAPCGGTAEELADVQVEALRADGSRVIPD